MKLFQRLRVLSSFAMEFEALEDKADSILEFVEDSDDYLKRLDSIPSKFSDSIKKEIKKQTSASLKSILADLDSLIKKLDPKKDEADAEILRQANHLKTILKNYKK